MINKTEQINQKIVKSKSGVIRAKSDFFRTARYGLTLQEHRIIYYAILHGQQNGTPFEPVTLSISNFKELCELKGQSSYSSIRKVSKKLISKTVEVVYKDQDGSHLMQAPWIVGITYHAKIGTVSIELNKKLQSFFEGKPFTDTEFYFLIKFTSQYAERLYEIIKSLSFKPLIDFDINDFRRRLCIGEKYPNFKDFRNRVIMPAISDINEYTDLEIDFREKRGKCNKVTDVIFAVSKKSVPKLSERISNGEFESPLNEDEQKAFLEEILDE